MVPNRCLKLMGSRVTLIAEERKPRARRPAAKPCVSRTRAAVA